MHILVTGAAGFIGSHFVELLSQEMEATVVGLDNFNEYYDPRIKRQNAEELSSIPMFKMIEGDFCNAAFVNQLFAEHRFTHVMHLGAYAGVRYSVSHPEIYFQTNVLGTLNLLEACRLHAVQRFVNVSSSTVYGNGADVPFREDGRMGVPASPYGASKRAAELAALNYHLLHEVPVVCVRPFSVYGPRVRPDLALAIFAKKILNGERISVFGDGTIKRDYTHVSDICRGLASSLTAKRAVGKCINLGHNQPVTIRHVIELLEDATGISAIVDFLSPRPEDLPLTCADLSLAQELLGYIPKFDIASGVTQYLKWLFHHNKKAEVLDLRKSLERAEYFPSPQSKA